MTPSRKENRERFGQKNPFDGMLKSLRYKAEDIWKYADGNNTGKFILGSGMVLFFGGAIASLGFVGAGLGVAGLGGVGITLGAAKLIDLGQKYFQPKTRS